MTDEQRDRMIFLAINLGMDYAFRAFSTMKKQARLMTPEQLENFVNGLEERDQTATDELNALLG